MLRVNTSLITAIFLLAGAAQIAFGDEKSPGVEDSDWIFLENSKLRLGVIRSAGAGIGFLSRSGSKQNLLNHYDRGRLIQQSYYGDADGSKWVDKSWCLNPVQGGDYKNAVPQLLETDVDKDKLYSKSIPLHWATGEKLDDFILEQWIELKEDLVHVRFRMSYKGKESHAPRHQEIPAVFLDPSLSDLVLYQGESPWTEEPLSAKQPGQKNEYFDIPENWAAFVDEGGEGVGVCVPSASQITCYRFRGGANSDCSYLAPITTFGFRPGMTFEYDAYFLVGKADEMRDRFEPLVEAARAEPKAEQDGAEQPATAPESKPEGSVKPKPESEVRPQ